MEHYTTIYRVYSINIHTYVYTSSVFMIRTIFVYIYGARHMNPLSFEC